MIVQTDGMQLLPVGCLPVKKLSDLLAVVTAYGIEVKDAGDGIKELAQPEGQAVFVKEADGWAYIGQSPAVLANVPENPQAILNEIVSEYDLGALLGAKCAGDVSPVCYPGDAIGHAAGDGAEAGRE